MLAMAIIPRKMTLSELSRDLKVSHGWIGKALRDLRMPRLGRGRTKVFSEAEVNILKNVMTMQKLGLTWNVIKTIRMREKAAADELRLFYKEVNRWPFAIPEDSTPRHHCVEFSLEEPFRFASNPRFSGGQPKAKESAILAKVEEIIKKHKLSEIEEELHVRNADTQAELQSFGKKLATRYYKRK